MNGELWQECRRRGCETEPVCVACELCERHCACAERKVNAAARQAINAIDSDRPGTREQWAIYRASRACPPNHQQAIDSAAQIIAAGRQTREDYDRRRQQFEAELYTMHAEGQYDVLRYMELEKVVNVIRELLGLCPFDGAGALTSLIARTQDEFAP